MLKFRDNSATFLGHCVSVFAIVVLFSASQELIAQNLAEYSHDWRFHSTDCHLVSGSWRVQTEKATQRGTTANPSDNCHRIDFVCQSGTEVLVSCETMPMYVIPELQVQLDVCSEQSNLQLFLEITFPRTASPTGDGPMTVLIAGPKLSESKKWSTLYMGGPTEPLTEALKERLWVLRRKFNIPIDERGAHVSRVIVNAYSAPGSHRVWLKEPLFSGTAAKVETYRDPVIMDLNVAPVSFDDDDKRPPARSQRAGTILEVDRTPFLAKIVQHNGEPFEYLKQLGFNTIQLAATATGEQLQQARQLQIWLICPPPPSTGLKPIGDFYDPVLAWSLGDELTSSNVAAAQNTAREIRIADSKLNRPLFVNANSDFATFGQSADLLSVGVSPIGTNFPLIRYSNWLQTISTATGNHLPICADIQTESLGQIIQQAGFLTGRISPTPLEREQLQSLVYEAIAGGARALRFRSRSRLDSNDPQTRLRSQTLQWLNEHVSLLEPWIIGGVVMGEVSNQDDLTITTLKTNRGQLLLVQRVTGLEQFFAGDPPVQLVRVQDVYSAIADQAYLLNDAGLTPLPNERNTSGGEIQIDKCPALAAIILTQNPAVLNRVNQTLERFGTNAAIDRRAELTRQWMSFTQIAENELGRLARSNPVASGAFNEAMNALQQAESLILSNSYQTALPFLDLADQKLATVRRALLTIARDQFSTQTSAPLLSHISLLARHWELTQSIPALEQIANGLPGGDFENLEHMLRNGWEQIGSSNSEIETHVELSESAAGAGDFGLLLIARGAAKSGAALDVPPLVIRSAAVPVRNSQMFLVHGWIRIDTTLQNTENGVVIYDSVGGRPLALQFGKTNGWQEFKLYRAVGESTSIRLTIEMTGLGTAMLDEITIRTIDIPAAAPATAPTNLNAPPPTTARRESETADKK